jgi:fatty-acyl-CoA synthase
LTEIRTVSTTLAGGRSVAKDWLRALEASASIIGNPQCTLLRVIEQLAEQHSEAPALLSVRETLTYRALAERANRYARWALGLGLRKGDVVGLMMSNRPEYVAIWLGLSSVGVVVSLLNTQLRGQSLAHCINIVAPAHIIVAAELSGELDTAATHLSTSPKVWSHGDQAAADSIDRAIERLSGTPYQAADQLQVTIKDLALLIYTSGTTGLPKAAKVSHRRVLQWSLWFAGLMDTGPDDRMYNCLPMYHSVGGVVAIGALLARGGSVMIREKFSVQQFWDDIVDFDCTLFQYIGELCRYLINTPSHPSERAHRIRMCCGNGLRADVWEKFQQRFAIPRILEFYAATEGNVSLYNVEGKVGAIGRVPSFLAHRPSLTLVKSDPIAGAPMRDEKGFCVRCVTNEVGEAIGRIRDDSVDQGAEFEGYTDVRDSKQKILRDVFERGDCWYRTGDLMRRDEQGFFYFVDRVGDTFRWKGENVATSEVAGVITDFPGIVEANVYGVHVPGTEGAACMVAIVAVGEPDLVKLRAYLTERLPAYARPLFLRITGKLEATATFKHIKGGLKREGYDPAVTSDTIYFDHPAQQAFVRLDHMLYELIQCGKVRL